MKGCVTSKKLEGLPFKANVTRPLPGIRVNDSPPFTNTSLTYFTGPLFVYNVDSQLIKSFMCLFTCNSSRAIHLSLLGRMGVKSFLRSFCHFVQTYFADCGIHWEFIAEKATLWGGMWECMIRSVKRCIKKAVGQASLEFEELHIILFKIEGVINARPITYVYDDSKDVSYPLTPSKLIYGRYISVTPNDKHLITRTHQSLTR